MGRKIVIVSANEDKEDAEKYVTALGYEILGTTPFLESLFKDEDSGEVNVGPFVIGITSILMAKAGNVYFANGWKKDLHCKILFDIAFNYGINIIMPPEDH